RSTSPATTSPRARPPTAGSTPTCRSSIRSTSRRAIDSRSASPGAIPTAASRFARSTAGTAGSCAVAASPGASPSAWTRPAPATSADEAKPDEARQRRVAADQRSEARTEDDDEGLALKQGQPLASYCANHTPSSDVKHCALENAPFSESIVTVP